VLHSGRTIRDVAESIGVHEIALGKWVNKAKGGDSDRDEELSETERAEWETTPQGKRPVVDGA
jgi:transposase-like protein